VLIMVGPGGSGGMIGLLPELARDYGVSGQQVAWINGVGGALLTAAGAFAASLVPVRVRTTIGFSIAALVNAATLVILALGRMSPAIYFTGTVLYLFTVGTAYAFVTAVILEFIGKSGKSGSGRYSIINSLANVSVAYMIWLDGRGYALWGPRGMPGIDASVSGAASSLLLAHFVFSRRKKDRE
jgi:PAT family beta-lactamase induction signal transducer AmpG